MATEQNKAILRRWAEGWSTGDLKVIDALADEAFTADFVVHEGAKPAAVMGREGVKQFVRAGLKGTPDMHLTIEDIIAEGDRVAVRWTVGGTDASSGKPRRSLSTYIYRFAGGQIAEVWTDLSAEAPA